MACSSFFMVSRGCVRVVPRPAGSRCTLLFVCNSEVTSSVRLVGCNVIASSCDRDRQCSSGMHMR